MSSYSDFNRSAEIARAFSQYTSLLAEGDVPVGFKQQDGTTVDLQNAVSSATNSETLKKAFDVGGAAMPSVLAFASDVFRDMTANLTAHIADSQTSLDAGSTSLVSASTKVLETDELKTPITKAITSANNAMGSSGPLFNSYVSAATLFFPKAVQDAYASTSAINTLFRQGVQTTMKKALDEASGNPANSPLFAAAVSLFETALKTDGTAKNEFAKIVDAKVGAEFADPSDAFKTNIDNQFEEAIKTDPVSSAVNARIDEVLEDWGGSASATAAVTEVLKKTSQTNDAASDLRAAFAQSMDKCLENASNTTAGAVGDAFKKSTEINSVQVAFLDAVQANVVKVFNDASSASQGSAASEVLSGFTLVINKIFDDMRSSATGPPKDAHNAFTNLIQTIPLSQEAVTGLTTDLTTAGEREDSAWKSTSASSVGIRESYTQLFANLLGTSAPSDSLSNSLVSIVNTQITKNGSATQGALNTWLSGAGNVQNKIAETLTAALSETNPSTYSPLRQQLEAWFNAKVPPS